MIKKRINVLITVFTLLAAGFLALIAVTPDDVLSFYYTQKRQGNLLVLMYHDISLEAPQDTKLMAVVTTGEKLTADIDALLELDYLPISLEDYYNGKVDSGQKYFALTFDDGYMSVYDIAYPILREKQIPAAVFFNTGMEHYPAFLHYQQLQELEQSGLVKIYTHLAYHDRATKLPLEEFIHQLESSVDFLNTYVGEKPMFMAYPYGDYNRITYRIVREHGILLQFAQKIRFPAEDILVRVNVPYNIDIKKLIKESPHN